MSRSSLALAVLLLFVPLAFVACNPALGDDDDSSSSSDDDDSSDDEDSDLEYEDDYDENFIKKDDAEDYTKLMAMKDVALSSLVNIPQCSRILPQEKMATTWSFILDFNQ